MEKDSAEFYSVKGADYVHSKMSLLSPVSNLLGMGGEVGTLVVRRMYL